MCIHMKTTEQQTVMIIKFSGNQYVNIITVTLIQVTEVVYFARASKLQLNLKVLLS